MPIDKDQLKAIAFELLEETIPERKKERVIAFLNNLERKKLSKNIKQQLDISPEFVLFFAEVITQVERALGAERIEYLACFVKNVLQSEEVNYTQISQLLLLLKKLSDIEIIILQYFQWKSYLVANPNESISDEYKLFCVKNLETIKSLNEFCYYVPQSNLVEVEVEVDLNEDIFHQAYLYHLIRIDLVGMATWTSSKQSVVLDKLITKLGDRLISLISASTIKSPKKFGTSFPYAGGF